MATPTPDLADLSETQQLALQQYTSVTDQDVQAAIPVLQRSQWNVQIAIAKFFDGEGPDLVAEAIAAQNIPAPRASRQENLQHSLLAGSRSPVSARQPDEAPRIVPQSDEVIRRPPFLLALLFTPFNLLYRIFASSLGFIMYLFPFLPRLLRPNTTTGTTRRRNTGGRRSLKPRDAAARLKREFEEEYGENNLPFYEGGYAQALDLAKKDLKFLIIVLLSPEHDDTSSFVRESLLALEVQAFFNDSKNNVLLWVGDVQDSEAYQVSTALACNKLPYTAVVAHTPRVSSTAMSVVTRVTGPMDASTYIAKISSAISTHEEQLSTVRAARNAQVFERSMRQEQDSAYERSLAADRERVRLRKEAEAQASEEERKKKADAEAAQNLATKRLQWRRWRATNIAEEPSTSEKDVVRIALKMPEHMAAVRVTRRFRASDSVEAMYAFVECYDILQGEGHMDEKAEKPEGYKHEFKFRIVQTLPRVVYGADDAGSIGERIGRSGNLIVEEIKEDEDDDEE